MSTATQETAGTSPVETLDVSGTTRVSLLTLIKVEVRKMADTRAGMWLLIAIAAVSAIVVAIAWLAFDTNDRTWFNLMGMLASPQGLLLPVLGILLVTQEWGQRTGMVTFTLEPNRKKVIAAKVVAALLFGLAAVFLAMILAAVGATLGGADNAWLNLGLDDGFKLILLQVISVLMGLAFGLLFLNSAAAIVCFFVVPIVVSLVSNLWAPLRDAAPWVDASSSQQALYSGGHMTGQLWWQLASTTAIWVAVPLAVGVWRVLRAEVK